MTNSEIHEMWQFILKVEREEFIEKTGNKNAEFVYILYYDRQIISVCKRPETAIEIMLAEFPDTNELHCNIETQYLNN